MSSNVRSTPPRDRHPLPSNEDRQLGGLVLRPPRHVPTRHRGNSPTRPDSRLKTTSGYMRPLKSARNPKKERWRWKSEQFHDYVLFMVNTGLRPDEAARLQFRDVSMVTDEATGERILEIEVRGNAARLLQEHERAVLPHQRGDDREIFTPPTSKHLGRCGRRCPQATAAEEPFRRESAGAGQRRRSGDRPYLAATPGRFRGGRRAARCGNQDHLTRCGRGEMVDAADSKSAVARRVGSSPTARTNLLRPRRPPTSLAGSAHESASSQKIDTRFWPVAGSG